MIGLLNAVEKLDPDYGTAFTSLAIPEIFGAVLNYLRDHGSPLKVPRGLRENKLTVYRIGEEFNSWLGRPSTTAKLAVAKLAVATGLTEKEGTDRPTFRDGGPTEILDAPVESLDEDGSCTLGDLIGGGEIELSMDKLDLQDALGGFGTRAVHPDAALLQELLPAPDRLRDQHLTDARVTT